MRTAFKIAAMLSGLALAARWAPGEDGAGVPTRDDAAAFPAINTENPGRADIIAACLFAQYTYTQAECACGADHAMAEYSLNLRRALVMDTSRDATQDELDLLSSLSPDEVTALANHGLRVLPGCARRAVVPGE